MTGWRATRAPGGHRGVIVIGGAFTTPAARIQLRAWVREGFNTAAHPRVSEHVRVLSGRRTGSAAVAGGLVRAAEAFSVDFVLQQVARARDASTPATAGATPAA